MIVLVSSRSIACGLMRFTASTRFLGVSILLYLVPLSIVFIILPPYIVSRRYRNSSRRGSCRMSSSIS